jgi:hypothetical protein
VVSRNTSVQTTEKRAKKENAGSCGKYSEISHKIEKKFRFFATTANISLSLSEFEL